ncbi:MAG TPA: amino acid adenylation domain-containing protein, partial [Thermoanaerobaculia bacterium]|nr:amino acid adenylation domain-containing protein [Thermoanaerobaculia bacterium]
DDPAYIIFTSGSTGSPKGVLVRHRPAVNLIDWVNGRFAMGESDRVLFLTSLSFDLSVYDVFGLLAAGGSGRVALEEEVGTPEALVRILETEPITFWDSAPAALQQLVPFFPAASRSHHLRLVFQSGDWIPVGLPDQVRAAFPGAQVISLGGATEATVWSNVFPIESVDRRWVSIPYGRPIRNARYHVLDRELNPCPVGVAGDLYIGGGCLSWGYFGEPELTARKFIPDPFAQSPGDVLYATGDRARSWKDGNLEFLGRLDHQVKIRGFRIELGEIESTLAAHPAVRDAVILAREDNPGDKRLVAYVVPEGRLLEETSLRAFVRERLPRYMEPAAFVVLEHLPTTPNGKVDRKALPPPGRAEGSPEGLEVSGPIEELLAGMWCEVLGIGRAGRHDNFFELGGESLKATQLVSRVRQVFRVELPVRGFFEDPTIAGVARAIQDLWTAAQGRHAREIPPVRTARRDLPLPLSFAQERLWFLDQFAPGSPVYNVASALQLDGPLSIPVFAESLDQIVRRHEILRTTFGLWEGRPVQHITPPARFPLPLLDLGDLPAALQEREAARLAGEEARRSFDLASGPLLRVTLLRLSAARHMMLLTMHHIVSDGWSMWVAIREVAALYRAFLDGRPSPLPPMALQYADFAQWQRAWLDGEVLETQLAYWKERLDGAPQALELPSDRPRPAVPSFRGGREPFALSPELSAELAALGRRRGSTVFMTLLAGFQVLLSRYSGQEDLVVGTAIANRNRQELEGLIGFFVNSLALRANLSGAPGAEELLDRVRESALGAYAHQDVPFERVVDALQLERHLSRPPLFQVMFTLDAAAGEGGLELPGLSLRQIGVGTTTSKFDLTLALVEGRQGLAGTLIYSRDLFDPGTVQRLGEHLRNLLEGIAAQPNVPLERLPLLGVSERQQVLVEWNRSSFDDTRSTCLHELIAQVAVRQPDEPAVLVETGCLTYGELERRAERVARRLSALSVGPEDRVGVCFERSPDMVVALLGVLKAGAAYLPLDPSYPESRLRFMLADSGTRVALTDQARNWLAEAPGLRTIRLDGSADVEPGSAGRVPTRPLPGNLAYVIYTSGSTGQPKGVMISHRNVCNRLLYAAETGQVGAGDRVLQKASISFDLSILEIFAPLVAGGATVLARPGGQLDTAYLADFIAEQRVTHAFFTPSLLQSLLAEPGISRCTSLRAVSSSAEAISVDLQRRFADTLQARLFNRYGPTETSISVASWTCEPDSRERSVPIGRPMAGARLHVLDRKLAPVPVGVAGELYIAGVCLGRGYLGRGDLTAESFLPNPLAEAEGERLYRTGDLARYRADGNLEFLGRIDHQVKIRGLRIELGEIEAVLEQHPGVHEALVLAREDSAGEKRLAAYWVAEPGAAPEERELPAYLAERLPAYMVPASFVRLSAFPLSPNGKIDRTALPDPRDEMRLERGSEAAGTPEEEVVSGIWCDLLGRDRVGLDDSFFALGGHSLLATQAIARLRQAFQVDLPLRDIFEAPTVRGLAQRVALARRSGAGLPLATIPRVPRTGELPLSFGQRRLWFFQRMHPTDPAYNIPIAVRLSGALHVAALGAALREIVRRHEVLRTAFREVEGAPVLAISPRCEPDLPLIDLGGLSRDRQEAEARRLAELEARRPFDLAVAPLLRTTLLRLGGEGHLALFTMHHIASDGGSTEILLRELGLLYRAFTDRRPSPLPELALQYADFAAWQAQSLRGEARERQLAYWQRQLHGAPDLLQMPLDRPRPAVQRQRGANEPFLLPDALYADLKALSRREDVSLFMTLLAAFKALLWRHSGQEDLVVGTSIANRSRPEVQGLVGFFVNNLALRTSLAGDPSFLELLGRVRSVTLGAYAHQDLPFDLLVDALGVPHRPSHTPLFQVQFLFQSIPGERKRLADLGLSRFAVGSPTAKYDLTLNIVEEAGGLTGALNYNTDLFLPATVRRMAEQLQALLEEVASDPARPLSVLTAGGPAAWEGMLGDFNADFSEEIHAV